MNKVIAAYDYSEYSVVTTDAIGWYGRVVYCRYMDENNQEIGESARSIVFPESVVHCCSRNGTAYMTVTKDADGAVEQLVQLIDRKHDAPKYYLSLCLAPIYGSQRKYLVLVELFEHLKLQGVEHFYLYVKEIDKYSQTLIDDYIREEQAEVISLPTEHEIIFCPQLVAAADCLHRSRHHSRYVLFSDLDERFFSPKGYTLESFVREKLQSAPGRGAMRFTSRWVLRTPPPQSDYEGEKTLKQHLPMLVFHNSSAVPNVRIVQKLVLDPRKVLNIYVHHVEAYYPGYEGYEVPFQEMHIRHYRDTSTWDKQWFDRLAGFGPYEITSYPEVHMKKLFENIKNKLDRIYGHKTMFSH
ncbi:unnamed protein product [Cylicocyclus nassatus]|uniref:Glycosyltransferase family 92 protein n=1 Tax=Cylicocyclus nassatus TaxID=53992 RepID=A0AA36H365_CYLNA|nr:unnamed protein product [Cylicocyclus nassatus]